jgi:23S rRNA (cytidine1920-2'-O)/16S rRNA (cytidine1409-2'-O)-methyltransferase
MKRRADEVLVEQGLAPTRSKARALIMAGQVRIGDRVIDKAGLSIDPETPLEVISGPQFVSRGGEKLAHALDAFGIDPTGNVCADLGASTGGFTDVLLQRGASRVYAIDVGYGQLDYSLRNDDRVIVMERVNARYLESLPEPVVLVVIDVSFISLAQIFPTVKRILAPDHGVCIALIKPQFEAGRDQVGKGGVVRDERIHRLVLERVACEAKRNELYPHHVTASPITGPKGNREFLMLFEQRVPMPDTLAQEIAKSISPGGESGYEI